MQTSYLSDELYIQFQNLSLPMAQKKTYSLLFFIFIFPFLFCPSYSQTSISTNNCPTEFNITIANETTSAMGNSSIAQFFFSTYMESSQKSKIQSYMIASNTKAIDAIASNQYIWPYVGIGAAFAITFIIVVMCIVFEKSCPPCQSWRRDFSKRPYELFEIRCVALFAVIFSIGILATSIASFTIIPNAQTNLKYTKCGLYGAVDVALNGDNAKWGGFSHIKNQVGNISKLLNSTNSQINNFFADNTNIKDSMNSMKSDNIKLYLTNKDAKVSTPDPYASNADLFTDSWFVKTYLGPQTQPNTMTNDLQSGLNITEKLSDQANQIIKSAFVLVQSSATISVNTATSQQLLTMYQNQLNLFKARLDVFSNKYFDPIFNWGIYVIEVVIGFVLVSSISVIIGSISIHFLKIYDCRHFLHFGWVIYGISFFGIVFTTYFLLPMGSMGYTFCQYYKGMLANQTEFDKISSVYSQNVINKLDTCLLGDGDVLKKFAISNEMNTVSNLFVNIEKFKSQNDVTNAAYVNQSISTDKISSWLTTLQKYRIGVIKDNDPNLLTEANAMISLAKLNQFSLWTTANSGDPIRRCSRDRWVYQGGDCNNNQSIFRTPATQPEGIALDMTLDTCISLNTKLQLNSPTIWILSDFQNRYKQIRQNCSVAYTKITEYAGAITKYRQSRINLFQGLIDQLTSLQTSHTTFNGLLSGFRSNLNSFSSTQTIVDLNNFVTNQIDGLLVSSKCTPIGDRMRFVYNSFCLNTMGNVVQLGICTILLMCLLIGGMLTGCVFAQRTATVKRLGKVNEGKIELNEGSVHSETFARKQKSESESSSSEQD